MIILDQLNTISGIASASRGWFSTRRFCQAPQCIVVGVGEVIKQLLWKSKTKSFSNYCKRIIMEKNCSQCDKVLWQKDALIRHENSVNCNVILSSYQKDVQCRLSKCLKNVGFSCRQGSPLPNLQMFCSAIL